MLHNFISAQLPSQVQILKEVHFSHNWNNKLNCDSFSTIRLRNDNKYVLLDLYKVFLKREVTNKEVDFSIVRLQSISHFYLHKVTPGITFIDANLPVIDFIELIKKMYKNKNIDFHRKQLSFLVFQHLSPDEIKELQSSG